MTQYFRGKMLSVASKLPPALLVKAGNAIRELELGRWIKSQAMELQCVVSCREDLFKLVASEVGRLPVLYLEFGVAQGEATRLWSSLLTHPDTLIHGFDSFEGLPEKWTENRPKGMFSTGGVLPNIHDPRVSFFKGWFEQTLPAYVPPSREVTIINLDADLYSSTILVLRKLQPVILPGTYIYFDEFSSYGHEERAFREFVDSTGAKFALRGATPGLLHVLFQCASTSKPLK